MSAGGADLVVVLVWPRFIGGELEWSVEFRFNYR